jgi:hypothetical protein
VDPSEKLGWRIVVSIVACLIAGVALTGAELVKHYQSRSIMIEDVADSIAAHTPGRGIDRMLCVGRRKEI